MSDEFKGKSVGQVLDRISVKELLDNSKSFTPSTKMYMAKRRLWDALEYNPVRTTDIRDIDLEEIAKLSGVPGQFFKWAETYPSFISWLCDKEYDKKWLDAVCDKAVQVLIKIAHSPIEHKLLTAKDKVAAVNLLMQLGDRFPNKRREFVYVDKELAKMTDADVQRENDKLDRLLGASKDVDT